MKQQLEDQAERNTANVPSTAMNIPQFLNIDLCVKCLEFLLVNLDRILSHRRPLDTMEIVDSLTMCLSFLFI